MKLTRNGFIWVCLTIAAFVYSGCSTVSSYISSATGGPYDEKEKISSTKEPEDEETSNKEKRLQPSTVSETTQEIDIVEDTTKETADCSEQDIEEEQANTPAEDDTYIPTDRELIDTALDYCQASIDFWEKGELDSAIDALDRAYSFTLKVDSADDPEIQREKEDLRYTISKRIMEVYASRYTVANGSHKAIPLEMNKYVEKALNRFKGKEKNFFLESYVRSGKYRPAIVKALKQAGLPEELSWLPLIESGFKVRALSRARALGMWQFIASTGYRYGLTRDTWIDERMDPEKSTEAAISYLSELHQIFGDWSTVLAAYNCGERRVLRLIRGQKINYLDNFWDLYENLPSETAFYVPKFLAVLHILNDPEAYGFDLPPLEESMEYEEVAVNKQFQLKTIAKHLDIEYCELQDLNPELRQNLTPKTTYSLKVPKGKAEVLLAKIKNIPAYLPPVPAYVVHRVRSGESLSVIAERYRTSIRAIMNMNGLRSRNYVRTGWRLKIPTSAGSALANANYSLEDGEEVKYVVQKGDSLWKIARRYNTTINGIMSLNGLHSTRLQIGQALKISTGVTRTQSSNTQKYIVRKGDSPYLIAKRYSMNLSEFLTLNSLTPRSTIFPGQAVKVVTR